MACQSKHHQRRLVLVLLLSPSLMPLLLPLLCSSGVQGQTANNLQPLTLHTPFCVSRDPTTACQSVQDGDYMVCDECYLGQYMSCRSFIGSIQTCDVRPDETGQNVQTVFCGYVKNCELFAPSCAALVNLQRENPENLAELLLDPPNEPPFIPPSDIAQVLPGVQHEDISQLSVTDVQSQLQTTNDVQPLGEDSSVTPAVVLTNGQSQTSQSLQALTPSASNTAPQTDAVNSSLTDTSTDTLSQTNSNLQPVTSHDPTSPSSTIHNNQPVEESDTLTNDQAQVTGDLQPLTLHTPFCVSRDPSTACQSVHDGDYMVCDECYLGQYMSCRSFIGSIQTCDVRPDETGQNVQTVFCGYVKNCELFAPSCAALVNLQRENPENLAELLLDPPNEPPFIPPSDIAQILPDVEQEDVSQTSVTDVQSQLQTTNDIQPLGEDSSVIPAVALTNGQSQTSQNLQALTSSASNTAPQTDPIESSLTETSTDTLSQTNNNLQPMTPHDPTLPSSTIHNNQPVEESDTLTNDQAQVTEDLQPLTLHTPFCVSRDPSTACQSVQDGDYMVCDECYLGQYMSCRSFIGSIQTCEVRPDETGQNVQTVFCGYVKNCELFAPSCAALVNLQLENPENLAELLLDPPNEPPFIPPSDIAPSQGDENTDLTEGSVTDGQGNEQPVVQSLPLENAVDNAQLLAGEATQFEPSPGISRFTPSDLTPTVTSPETLTSSSRTEINTPLAQLPANPTQPPLAQLPANPTQPPLSQLPANPTQPPLSQLPANPTQPPLSQLPANPTQPPLAQSPVNPTQPPLSQLPANPAQPPLSQLPTNPTQPPLSQLPANPTQPPLSQLPANPIQQPPSPTAPAQLQSPRSSMLRRLADTLRQKNISVQEFFNQVGQRQDQLTAQTPLISSNDPRSQAPSPPSVRTLTPTLSSQSLSLRSDPEALPGGLPVVSSTNQRFDPRTNSGSNSVSVPATQTLVPSTNQLTPLQNIHTEIQPSRSLTPLSTLEASRISNSRPVTGRNQFLSRNRSAFAQTSRQLPRPNQGPASPLSVTSTGSFSAGSRQRPQTQSTNRLSFQRRTAFNSRNPGTGSFNAQSGAFRRSSPSSTSQFPGRSPISASLSPSRRRLSGTQNSTTSAADPRTRQQSHDLASLIHQPLCLTSDPTTSCRLARNGHYVMCDDCYSGRYITCLRGRGYFRICPMSNAQREGVPEVRMTFSRVDNSCQLVSRTCSDLEKLRRSMGVSSLSDFILH